MLLATTTRQLGGFGGAPLGTSLNLQGDSGVAAASSGRLCRDDRLLQRYQLLAPDGTLVDLKTIRDILRNDVESADDV
jgi:hypothetical protein